MNAERVLFAPTISNTHSPDFLEGSNSHFQYSFATFLDSFTRGNVRIYHRQIYAQLKKNRPFLRVELSDLKAYEENIYIHIMSNPLETVKTMEDVVRRYVKEKRAQFQQGKQEEWFDYQWQVALRSDQLPRKMRDIGSNMVSKLFVVSGIIITSTKPYIKASKLKLQCKNCLTVRTIELAPGQYPYVPIYCTGQAGSNTKCPNDPFVALPDSEVIDTQTLKIQESPQDVPTGEIARTYTLVADRHNVSRCVPGDRVLVTGVMFVNELKTENLSKGYIYITDISKMQERTSFHYTEADEENFKKLARDPNCRNIIYDCIAPGIFGNEEIKKAIACMLFGGSRKHLPDQTWLRGDINILLIGDPSTAKSQFLKFVQQTSAIAVYTSGKGSSAAGLTASINKDPMTGQFQIQGGALVLADGGIVCIDQFDKMKPADRVAIHEAMEQQTISVAKAGITTRLNSRTSILAAANPIHGRYDDFKEISDQIQLQTTILSRFDCIFVVRDVNTVQNNQRIADHILGLHQGKIMRPVEKDVGFEFLKKYIHYSKGKQYNPRLTVQAAEKLQELYVADRQKAYDHKKLTQSKNSIPITVRQLEAVIRLSEALARMRLKNDVGIEEVDEAHYLFELSTLKSIDGKELGYQIPENVVVDVQKIEEIIRKRVCIGNQVSISKLMEDMEERHNSSVLAMALRNLVRNGQFREIKGKKQLIRER